MQITKSKSYKFYNSTACEYDEVRFSGPSGKWGTAIQEQIISDHASKWNNMRILEVGCGTGRCTDMLLSLGCKNIIAIEPAAEMISIARKRCAHGLEKKHVQFILSDIESLDSKPPLFDVVMFVNVFSRLPNAEELIGKLVDMLKIGGILFFNFQCLNSILFPFGMLVNKKKRSLSRPVFSQWYTTNQIYRILIEKGLDVCKWQGHHYIPSPKVLSPLLPLFMLAEKSIQPFSSTFFPSVFVSSKKL